MIYIPNKMFYLGGKCQLIVRFKHIREFDEQDCDDYILAYKYHLHYIITTNMNYSHHFNLILSGLANQKSWFKLFGLSKE